MPADRRLKDLRVGYQAMQAMMFDETAPLFDEVLERSEKLQDAINTTVPTAG